MQQHFVFKIKSSTDYNFFLNTQIDEVVYVMSNLVMNLIKDMPTLSSVLLRRLYIYGTYTRAPSSAKGDVLSIGF